MEKRLVLVFFIILHLCASVYAGDSGKDKGSGQKASELVDIKKTQQNIKNDTGPMILKVEIKGLVRVKTKKVLAVVASKKGKCYSVDNLVEDVRSILALGYFDSVVPDFDNNSGILTFVVSEKPYVDRIVFRGNVEFSVGKLKRISVLKEKKYYNSLDLDETNKKILALYGDMGYIDCQVDVYPTIDTDTNKMTITFLITENNKSVVGGVKINGVVSVKTSKILKLMKTKPKKAFKEEIFELDLCSVQAFYKNCGFMDYEFISFDKVYNETRTEMFLTLTISEGCKYKIGNISCTGNTVFDDKKIRKMFNIKQGQVFNQSKIDETKDTVCVAYSDKGYLDAVVDCEFIKKEEGVVDVIFKIEEKNIFYVGSVNIGGLVSTKDKIIRREILLKPGDVLASNKVRKSVQKIYNLGFIENVDRDIIPTNTSNVNDLSFLVTETRSGMVNAGITYSMENNVVGTIGFRKLNTFGIGLQTSASLEYGKKRRNFEVEITDPWIFGKNASLTFGCFGRKLGKSYVYSDEETKKREKEEDGYSQRRMGFVLDFSPRIGDDASFLFGYHFEHVKLVDIDRAVQEAKGFKEDRSFSKHKDGVVSSIVAQIMYDSTDYVFDPSSGTKSSLGFQLASKFFGGDENFVKGTVNSSWYFPTFWRFVLGVNVRFGVICAPVGDGAESIPIYEKFCVGGVNSIKGYKSETEIGPKNGGTVEGVANVEYKFPIISSKGRTILQGVVFYDIGGVWKDLDHINLSLGPGRKNLHQGVGFGIRAVGPALVPVAIYCAWGLNNSKGESLQLFNFNIGLGF